MTTLYKITRNDLTTHGGFQYHVGEWTPRLTVAPYLCTPTVYHAYLSPQLALLLNPIHGNYPAPFRLWRAEGEIVVRDRELKVGVQRLKLIDEIVYPDVTIEQRITFAIHCALTVCARPSFHAWAEAWLSGEDRTAASASTAEAARAAAWAAEAAAWAAEAVTDISLLPIAAASLLPWDPING